MAGNEDGSHSILDRDAFLGLPIYEAQEFLRIFRIAICPVFLAKFLDPIFDQLINDLTEQIGDPTIADGILDRLVHNAHRIEMRGESMRKKRDPPPDEKKE